MEAQGVILRHTRTRGPVHVLDAMPPLPLPTAHRGPHAMRGQRTYLSL